MTPFEDMPTLEFTDIMMFEVVDGPKPALPDMTVVTGCSKPVYQEWGFWILLVMSIVVSFASGILIRTGSLFG